MLTALISSFSDMIDKARNTSTYFCKKGLFSWFPDVPVYQDFSRQVQIIAGKESYDKGMKWIDLLLVIFKTISFLPPCMASLIKWGQNWSISIESVISFSLWISF